MTNKLKIWGRLNSTNVKKVQWVAEELGLPYESIIVGGQYGGTKTPEYLAMNPNATVPTLEDGDYVLWESNAIVRYLAAQYKDGKTSLWVEDARARGLGDQWADWTTATFVPDVRNLILGILRTPPDQQDWTKINATVDTCNALLAIPEATLAKQPYLSGQEFGVGDIALGCFIYAWYEMPKIKRAETPHLRAWYERLRQRPGYQKAVMIELS